MSEQDQGQLGREPQAGDWLILRRWGVEFRQIEKVTAKLMKLGGATYPRQVNRDDRAIIAVVAGSREEVERLCQSMSGAEGEYLRREQTARHESNARIQAAIKARDKAIERLLLESGIPHTSPSPSEQ